MDLQTGSSNDQKLWAISRQEKGEAQPCFGTMPQVTKRSKLFMLNPVNTAHVGCTHRVVLLLMRVESSQRHAFKRGSTVSLFMSNSVTLLGELLDIFFIMI